MATRPPVLTQHITRNKLALFVNNQESIRLLENLLKDVGNTLPDATLANSEAIIEAQNTAYSAVITAEQALSEVEYIIGASDTANAQVAALACVIEALRQIIDDLLQEPWVGLVGEVRERLTALDAIAAKTDKANAFANVQSVAPYRANISGAVSIDLAAAKSNILNLTLTGNVSSFALTNPADGATYSIRLIQDATAGRTFAGLPSSFKLSAAPTFNTAAGKFDFVSAQWGATEGSYAAAFLPALS